MLYLLVRELVKMKMEKRIFGRTCANIQIDIEREIKINIRNCITQYYKLKNSMAT